MSGARGFAAWQIAPGLLHLEVLDFDADAAAHAGEIRASLEREGNVIGGYDLLIAGHARSRGLIVVTGNLGEFERVEGLRSEDWEQPITEKN